MKRNKQFISIILPTYNEAGNIIDLIYEINNHIPKDREIVVVDDDSPDGTSELVKKEINKNKIKNLSLITRKSNKGLTPSIQEGIDKSKGDILVWMDCDFSMPPSEIPGLIKKINSGFDIAVASRFIKHGGFVTNIKGSTDTFSAIILSRLLNFTIQFFLPNSFKDYTSGFIAIRKEVLSNIRLQGDYGEYFMALITKSIIHGYKIIEVPTVQQPRRSGVSKTGSNLKQLLRRGSKYMIMMLRMWGVRIKHGFFIKVD